MDSDSKLDPNLIRYGMFLKALHDKWTPHKWQRIVLEELLVKKQKIVFLNCGRKFGKTEIAAYFLWRTAIEKPGSMCFYVAPTAELGDKVVWGNRRLIDFGPRDLLLPGDKGVKHSKLSLCFKNGSTIVVIGSTSNENNLRGVTPTAIVYDEFRDFTPGFHEAMDPNSLSEDCPLLILSTPPSKEEIVSGKKAFYVEMKELCEYMDEFSYFSKTSWENIDNLPKGALERKKKILLFEGKEYVWQREYEAKIVSGSPNTFFSDIKTSILTPHIDVMEAVRKADDTSLEWFVSVDPSGGKRWGVLFAAIDPRSRKLYLLDAIVLDGLKPHQKAKMSALILWDMISSKCAELNPNLDMDQWDVIYDSAEKFFQNEIHIHVGNHVRVNPVNKNIMSKMEGFTRIRDLIDSHGLIFSDRVSELIDEMQSFTINPTTEMPVKQFDELMDCLRYLFYELDYFFLSEYETKKKLNRYKMDNGIFINLHKDDPKSHHRDGLPSDFIGDFQDLEW